jgi:hypothetical protein
MEAQLMADQITVSVTITMPTALFAYASAMNAINKALEPLRKVAASCDPKAVVSVTDGLGRKG